MKETTPSQESGDVSVTASVTANSKTGKGYYQFIPLVFQSYQLLSRVALITEPSCLRIKISWP